MIKAKRVHVHTEIDTFIDVRIDTDKVPENKERYYAIEEAISELNEELGHIFFDLDWEVTKVEDLTVGKANAYLLED